VGALGVALSVQLLRRTGYRLKLLFSVRRSRSHLSESLPLCAAWLAVTFYIQVNYLILGKVHGEAEVGLYSAAARLASVLSAPLALYYAAIVPVLMAMYAHSKPKVVLVLNHSVRVTAVLGFGILTFGATAAPWLTRGVFGPAFLGSAGPLGIMLVSTAEGAVGHNWCEVAIAAHRQDLVLKGAVLGGLVNLLICALLVKPWGAVGAAAGNLLGQLVVHLTLFLPWPAEFRGWALRPAFGPAAACAIALLLGRVAHPWGVAWGAGLSAVAYVVGLFLFGSITENDLQAARSALASLVARPVEKVPHV
jgi:O-antigen/teichoic acid export membrane protein